MRSVVFREGVLAGIIGATSVAVWFLVIDVALQQPLRTPAALGRAFFGLFGAPQSGSPDLPFVLGYTVFHYLAFVAAGLLVAAIVQWAEKEPTVLAGALIFFVVFEVGFHLLLSMFRAFPVLGVMAWQSVAVGNLVAALAMGTYLWRRHPALSEELRYALESKE